MDIVTISIASGGIGWRRERSAHAACVPLLRVRKVAGTYDFS
jgi:hypothetical protein